MTCDLTCITSICIISMLVIVFVPVITVLAMACARNSRRSRIRRVLDMTAEFAATTRIETAKSAIIDV